MTLDHVLELVTKGYYEGVRTRTDDNYYPDFLQYGGDVGYTDNEMKLLRAGCNAALTLEE